MTTRSILPLIGRSGLRLEGICDQKLFSAFFLHGETGRNGNIFTPLYILSHVEQKIARVMSKQQIIKIILSVLIAALTALGAAFGLSSCNVVRTVTNRSEFYQRGDTSVTIQTKTIESYDAKKNLVY